MPRPCTRSASRSPGCALPCAFFAPFVADAEWLRLKKEIAWLNISLGAARDSDVVVEIARHKRHRAWAQHAIGERSRSVSEAGSSPAGSLPARRPVSTPDRFNDGLDQAWSNGWRAGNCGARNDAEPLPAYCERELNRWRKRLIRKGRHLETLNAARRHRLRIRIKRFRYMLEALSEIVPVRGRGKFAHVHRPAKRLQRTLGDLRDLKRFADLAASSPRDKGQRGKKRPPGYRRQKEELLDAALKAYREPQAGRSRLTPPSRTPPVPGLDVHQPRPYARRLPCRQQIRERGPRVLANVWENGDVQEHSGSHSIGTPGQAGD